MSAAAQSVTDAATLAIGSKIATCVGCACTDVKACPGGCRWIVVSYALREGLCSRCLLAGKGLRRKGRRRG